MLLYCCQQEQNNRGLIELIFKCGVIMIHDSVLDKNKSQTTCTNIYVLLTCHYVPDPSTSISSIDETSDTASLLPRVSTSSSSANFSHVFFHYMHAKYVLEADSMSFVRLHGWDRNKTNEQIITQGGFGEEKQDAMQVI